MMIDYKAPVILSPSFIWAKNPDFRSLTTIKTGFFATLRMTDAEFFGVNFLVLLNDYAA